MRKALELTCQGEKQESFQESEFKRVLLARDNTRTSTVCLLTKKLFLFSTEELTCSRDDGKCLCLSNVIGQRCGACADQYYWNPVGQGCVSCNCHSTGSVTGTRCNVTTGQCVCKANVGGSRCDRCSPGYYGFSNGM